MIKFSSKIRDYLRFLFISLLSFILFFCFYSCKRDQSSFELDNSNSIIFWSSSLKPYFTSYMEEIIASFERIYGIEVKWQDYPIDVIYQKLMTVYGSNLSPDVVNVNPLLSAGFYKRKMLVNLSIYDQKLENIYFSNLIEGCKIDNNLITVPWYSSTKLLVFNKEIFDFSKRDMKDYKDFFEEVKKIKEKKGVYGFYPFIKFEQDMLALELIKDPKDPFSDEVIEFFGLLRNYRDYLPSGFQVSSIEIAYSMYKDRKVASILIGPQFLYRLKKEDQKLYENTSVILFPFKSYPVTTMSLSVVNNGNKDKIQKSITFIKFLTNYENQLKLFKMVPIVPSIKGNYNFDDADPLISLSKRKMLEVFPKAKVFDLYFYSVIEDPMKRTVIFKNFMNDVFNSSLDMREIQIKYRQIWNENIVK